MYRSGVFLLVLSLSCSLYAQDFRGALYRYMPVMKFDSSKWRTVELHTS